MKRLPELKKSVLARGLAVTLLGMATLMSFASANDAVIQNSGGVTYISGGVGLESIDQLTAISGDFNLKLVFALSSGVYVSAVRVVIADTAGKTLLSTASDGPWFLAKLPAGNYRIVATFAGTAVTRQATVGAAKLSVINMRWASE